MHLKGKFPFRLGTTSYIVPGDVLLNVNLLCALVDDIEIVLFESDEIAPLPDCKIMRLLQETAMANGLSYTVHLPLDIWLGDSNISERRSSVEKCLRAVKRTSLLNPIAFVLHCNRCNRGGISGEDPSNWRKNIKQSIYQLIDEGVEPAKLCIETLEYPFNLIEDIIQENKLSICIDIGHIIFNNLSIKNYLEDYFDKSRIIHLHGVLAGKDHCDISKLGMEILLPIISKAKSEKTFPRVITLEVFNKLALDASLKCMEIFLQ